jgi:DNA polymerase III sliding clamp (beta) subunit (PCNA family)
MLSDLKFVQGSVAKKDYLPALTHFCIENGTVRGYNGTLALCSPIPFDIACKPRADKMVQAIRNCTDTISLSMTPAGKLSIKSGKFKAFVECVEGETNHVEPEGDIVQINGEAMLQAVRALSEFVGDDASRPWSNGMLFRGQSAFATNNIIVVEFWMGVDFPLPANIPRAAIKEILRINEAPTHAQVSETSFTLHYSNGRWIRTQLLATDWPELGRIMEQPHKPHAIPGTLFAALESVKPFCDKLGRVTFHEGAVCSSLVEGEGARFEVEGLDYNGSYQVDMMLSLNGVATSIDLTTYPRPCIFYGDRIRGAIIGMRQL